MKRSVFFTKLRKSRFRGLRKSRKGRMARSIRSMAIKNYFKYKRYCPDSTIQNATPGVVTWDDARTNWSVANLVPDDNGLFQFGGAMRFQLNDVISPSDFTNLYDRYKITGVKITFIPLVNQGYTGISTSTNQSSATIPTINYCVDYDDSVVPVTSLDILEKMDAKVRRLDRPFSVYIKNPKVETIVNSDSGAVAGQIGSAGYYNCAQDTINFRGLKFWIRDMALPAAASNLNSLIRVQTKYYLAFKDPQ